MKLHVVSFQVPFPPDYGGLIDVYYKLKALKEAGCSVVLHTYRYEVAEQPDLLKVVDAVYYYERFTGWCSMFSFRPYIVYSRRSKLLLERLCEDDSPILFEGLHTCYFLSNPLLRDRQKWVRMHYERVLLYADKILAITNTDALYFTQKYPFVSTYCLPCFFDNISVETVTDVSPENEKYILYHGNLSVLENVRVINYILDNLLPKLDINMRVVIAGKNPDKHLREKISRIPNVSLVANPLQEEMNSLIVFAHIHLLLTFQNTGIKLKLIYSLMKGHGHCLVNSMMIPDPGFEEVCTIADGQEAQVIALRKLYHTPLMPEALQWRQQALTKMGYNNQVTLILH
mgnify:CR=1 FL=1